MSDHPAEGIWDRPVADSHRLTLQRGEVLNVAWALEQVQPGDVFEVQRPDCVTRYKKLASGTYTFSEKAR